jgi:lipopolysaccharide/colanic/teichoic acid biosynthesis glycosyltransferase
VRFLAEQTTLRNSFYLRHGKRWFDAVASFFGLLLLSPFLVLAAIAVSLDSPGSSFFLQNRVGKREETFQLFKFRSMRPSVTAGGPLITARDDARVTRVGRWLRRTKVDELPQLLNVLRGDMSLVGPRPEVSRYTKLYNGEQKQVFAARPGITGPAAIVYANEEELLSRQDDQEKYYVQSLLPAKLELDLIYCRNVSFRGDLALIFKTLGRLFDRRHKEGALIPSSSEGIQESS